MNHYPNDRGMLRKLTELSGQKTVKTMCGRYVNLENARHDAHIDCSICRQELEVERDANLDMAELGIPDQVEQYVGEKQIWQERLLNAAVALDEALQR